MFKTKKLIKLIGPAIFLLIYIGLLVAFRGRIPETAVLMQQITGLYGHFGYSLVFFGAFLEVLFLIGFYVPGSVVVLLGAALAKQGIVQFPYVYLLGSFGAVCGYIINYMLGRFGLQGILSVFGLTESMKGTTENIRKHGPKAIFVGYFFPGSGSFFSTAAGVLGMPFKTFLVWSIVSQLFWSLLWGSLAYFFGLQIVTFIIRYFVFVVFGVLLILLLRRVYLDKKKK
jgi:membrane-associated protein